MGHHRGNLLAPRLYPQQHFSTLLAPNRAPVQVVRVGRAVLNQKQNRSIGKAVSAAEGATAPLMSLCPVTYPAPSWRGLQAVCAQIILGSFEDVTDMALPARVYLTLHETSARWGCNIADIAGWADAGRFRILTGITAVRCGDEVFAGKVTLSPMELMPLFRRCGMGPS